MLYLLILTQICLEVLNPIAMGPVSDHISILEQEFERRAITVISFGVLASEFHAESKNTNLFAGECHEFFGQKTKGGTLTVENFQ